MIEATTICNHTFLPHLITEGSVVADIGANHGEFSGGMLERFPCRLIAAEPVKELYDNIQRNPRLNLMNVAVGGENGWITINVPEKGCATILEPAKGERTVPQQTELVTLAEFQKRGQADHIDLLKIDIEGAEIGLFASTPDADLQSVGQITIEFHDWLFPDQKQPVIDIRKRLRDLGFWDLPFSLDSTNVLFVNRKTGVSMAEATYLRTFVRFGQGIPRVVKRLTRA